jgi:predicted Zn finger-like uncharacterized protein
MIVCPTCATSYMVDPASLGPDGRTVRCARCRTTWHAGGPQEKVADFVADVVAENETNEGSSHGHTRGSGDLVAGPETAAAAPPADVPQDDQQSLPHNEAPPLVPPDEPQVEPSIEPSVEPRPVESDDVESFAARRARLQERRKSRRRSSKWTAVVLVLFGFNVALIGARNEVVRYFPQTASLFAAIGMPVNLRSLSFEDVHINKDEHDGVAVLTVEGNIVSVTAKPVEVPRLRFAVRNVSGQEIYAWTSAPPRSILQAGDKAEFRSRLASPPGEAADVMVRFVNANDADTGAK